MAELNSWVQRLLFRLAGESRAGKSLSQPYCSRPHGQMVQRTLLLEEKKCVEIHSWKHMCWKEENSNCRFLDFFTCASCFHTSSPGSMWSILVQCWQPFVIWASERILLEVLGSLKFRIGVLVSFPDANKTVWQEQLKGRVYLAHGSRVECSS